MATTLTDLFTECLYASYTHTENDGDYALKRDENTLYIYFQGSNGVTDWKNNFDFPATPYSDMGIKWYCHRGFLKVWKSIRDCIAADIADKTVTEIVIAGYSHGAAIATLCHEYCWFERKDIRDHIHGYGFGCPRVFWGVMKNELKERWQNFTPIRNLNDIVTHVPPVILGFRHVNTVRTIGTELAKTYKSLKCVNAHYAVNYLHSLREINSNGD